MGSVSHKIQFSTEFFQIQSKMTKKISFKITFTIFFFISEHLQKYVSWPSVVMLSSWSILPLTWEKCHSMSSPSLVSIDVHASCSSTSMMLFDFVLCKYILLATFDVAFSIEHLSKAIVKLSKTVTKHWQLICENKLLTPLNDNFSAHEKPSRNYTNSKTVKNEKIKKKNEKINFPPYQKEICHWKLTWRSKKRRDIKSAQNTIVIEHFDNNFKFHCVV